MSRYFPETMVARPVETVWRAWISSLKTGDEVLVCDYLGSRSIYTDTVRVTPTGRVHLGKSLTNWARSTVTDLSGGGPRFLAPVPPGCRCKFVGQRDCDIHKESP